MSSIALVITFRAGKELVVQNANLVDGSHEAIGWNSGPESGT